MGLSTAPLKPISVPGSLFVPTRPSAGLARAPEEVVRKVQQPSQGPCDNTAAPKDVLQQLRESLRQNLMLPGQCLCKCLRERALTC